MMTFTGNTTNKDFEKVLIPEMEKPIDHFRRELVKLRTGRATASMVEDLVATCYGTPMSFKEIAAISVPEARLIVIQPWDKSNLKEIEKAITASDLGVTPLNDGEIVRIQLPQISSSRREELLKVLNKKLEECRVAIRSIRKEFQNSVRTAEKAHTISEDFAKQLLDILQKQTDTFIANAEEISKKKEESIRID